MRARQKIAIALENEFRILSELRHELIVSAKGLLKFPDGNSGFLMEYAGEWDRKKEPASDDEPRRDTLARELKVVGRLSLNPPLWVIYVNGSTSRIEWDYRIR